MTIRKLIALLALLWAIVISIGALFMPPMGEIDGSVLILIAQIIIFIATIFGIELPDSFRIVKK